MKAQFDKELNDYLTEDLFEIFKLQATKKISLAQWLKRHNKTIDKYLKANEFLNSVEICSFT